MFSRILQATLLASAMVAGPAAAQVVNEAGDAGELLATAQVTSGYVALINGALDSATDTDIYRISIVNPAGFSVSVQSDMASPDDPFPYLEDDTALFLFDGAGFLVGFADDQFEGGVYTYAPRFNLGEFASLAAGDYYLAFNNFSRQPTVESGPFFFPGLGEGPLTGWTGQPGIPRAGAYALTLTGVGSRGALPDVPPGVPEPGAWALMILGFGATGAAVRRRRKLATA